MGKTIEEFLETYMDDLRKDISHGRPSPDTLRSYQTSISRFLDWCNQKNIGPLEVIESDAKDYRDFLWAAGRKTTTVSLHLSAVRHFFRLASKMDLYHKKNPFGDIFAGLPVEKSLAQLHYLEAEHVQELFDGIAREEIDPVRSIRDRLIIALMILQGLKVIEIEQMNVEDLDLDQGAVLIRGRRKQEWVPVRFDVVELIKAYLELSPLRLKDSAGTPLFASVSNRSQHKRLTRVGIRAIINSRLEEQNLKRPGLSCQTLRDTCGALMYKAGGDLTVVQDVMRHSKSESAQKFIKVQERLLKRYTEAIPVKVIK